MILPNVAETTEEVSFHSNAQWSTVQSLIQITVRWCVVADRRRR